MSLIQKNVNIISFRSENRMF